MYTLYIYIYIYGYIHDIHVYIYIYIYSSQGYLPFMWLRARGIRQVMYQIRKVGPDLVPLHCEERVKVESPGLASGCVKIAKIGIAIS